MFGHNLGLNQTVSVLKPEQGLLWSYTWFEHLVGILVGP